MNNVNYSNIYNDDHIYIYENDQIMQNLLTRIRRLRAEQEELYDSINGFDDTTDFDIEEIPPPYRPRLPFLEQIISYRQ